jgi:hypothetical protein
MRFILGIFALTPLAVAAFATALVLYLLFKQGFQAGIVAVLLIFGSLTTILAYMAFRILRRPQLELAPAAPAPPLINTFIVGLVVLQTSAMVVFAFAYNLGTFSVRNWIGPVCIILGLYPLCSGTWLLLSTRWKIRRRNNLFVVGLDKVRVAVATHDEASKILIPSYVLAVLVVVGVYYSFNGARYLSLFDLSGVIFFILSGLVVQVLDKFRFKIIRDHAQKSFSTSPPP